MVVCGKKEGASHLASITYLHDVGDTGDTAVLAKAGHAEEGRLAALLLGVRGERHGIGRDDRVLPGGERSGRGRGRGRGAAALFLKNSDLGLAVGAVEDALKHGVDVLAVGEADVAETVGELGRHDGVCGVVVVGGS